MSCIPWGRAQQQARQRGPAWRWRLRDSDTGRDCRHSPAGLTSRRDCRHPPAHFSHTCDAGCATPPARPPARPCAAAGCCRPQLDAGRCTSLGREPAAASCWPPPPPTHAINLPVSINRPPCTYLVPTLHLLQQSHGCTCKRMPRPCRGFRHGPSPAAVCRCWRQRWQARQHAPLVIT